jgi:hypothetical protein
LRTPVLAALERIITEVSEDTCPTLHGQAKAYLG